MVVPQQRLAPTLVAGIAVRIRQTRKLCGKGRRAALVQHKLRDRRLRLRRLLGEVSPKASIGPQNH